MRIAIICPDYPPKRSGLADHTVGLAQAIARWAEVEIFTSAVDAGAADDLSWPGGPNLWILREVEGWGFRGIRRLGSALRAGKFDWVLVQYVPHMYGPRGFSFALPYGMWRWRAAGVLTLLLVHELYLDWSVLPRRLAAAIAQRLMFWSCAAVSRRVGVSIAAWLGSIRRAASDSSGKFFLLPTPSNFERELRALPPAAASSSAPENPPAITLGFFGTLHDSKLIGHLTHALHHLR